MKLNPYLTFDGQCAEAMAFYQSVLGGDLTMMTFGDMPDTSMVPDGLGDRVAHARLVTAGVALQASDSMGGAPAGRFEGFNLQLEPGDVASGRTLFDRLSEGGTVVMAFEPTFWSAGFGICRDRFGVPWMVNCE